MTCNRAAATAAFSLLVGGLLGPASGAAAQDLNDVEEVVQRTNLAAYYAGDDGRAQVRMTITDGAGRRRTRQFTILRRDETDGGDQDYAMLFSSRFIREGLGSSGTYPIRWGGGAIGPLWVLTEEAAGGDVRHARHQAGTAGPGSVRPLGMYRFPVTGSPGRESMMTFSMR